MPFALLIQFYAFLCRSVGCEPAGERSFLPVNDFVHPGTAREKRTRRQNERERHPRLGGHLPPAPSTGVRRPSWPQLVDDSPALTARPRSSSQKRRLTSGWKVTRREARLGLPGDGVPSPCPCRSRRSLAAFPVMGFVRFGKGTWNARPGCCRFCAS